MRSTCRPCGYRSPSSEAVDQTRRTGSERSCPSQFAAPLCGDALEGEGEDRQGHGTRPR